MLISSAHAKVMQENYSEFEASVDKQQVLKKLELQQYGILCQKKA